MCRNHRGFVDASVAVAKLGADILYLNTAFAGPQLVDVLEREQPTVVIHDEEFTDLISEGRHRATPDRVDATATPAADTIESLIVDVPDGDLSRPSGTRGSSS